MGYAEKAARAAADALAVSLSGLRVVLDVQHLYRDGQHAGDRGSLFTLQGGTHIWEAAAATTYAAAAAAWLRARGAAVLTNDPTHGVLVGPYSARNRAASAFPCHAYLACHVNAGGGEYALAEYMAGSPGQALGAAIGATLTHTFRDVRSYKCSPLVQGQRGAVCIEAVDRRVSAVVLEPFFGDTPRMQALFELPYLAALGVAVGTGIAAWWADAKNTAAGATLSRR